MTRSGSTTARGEGERTWDTLCVRCDQSGEIGSGDTDDPIRPCPTCNGEGAVEVIPAASAQRRIEELEMAVEWVQDSGDGIEEADRDDDPLDDYAKGRRDAFHEAAQHLRSALSPKGESCDG